MDIDTIIKQDANDQKYQKPANKQLIISFPQIIQMQIKEKAANDPKIQDRFGNVFNSIGCFKSTFSLQLKSDSKPYQAPPRHVAYALQKPFKEELE